MSADRPGYIAGLRRLADLLEHQPALPLPYDGSYGSITLQFLHDGTPGDAAAKKQEMFLAAGCFPVEWEPREFGGDGTPAYTEAVGQLHGLRLTLVRFADGACRKCGGALPGHALTCALIPAGPEHPAGAQAPPPEMIP